MEPTSTSNSLGDISIAGKVRMRLRLLIRSLIVEPAGELVIRVNDPRSLDVTYRSPAIQEIESGAEMDPPLSRGDTVCVTTGEWSVSDRNRAALEKLARDGVELTQRFVIFGPMSGTGMPAWDVLPTGLQDLLNNAFSELGRAAARTYRLLRWYLALPGDHDPFRLWSFEWSPDGASWQELPRKLPLAAGTFVPTLRPLPIYADTIEKAIAGGTQEPIGHEMLREATCHLEQSPRSALIVGIAAAEIGFKEFVSNKAPAASWLVTEAPTPPLVTMLTEYFPGLLGLLKSIPVLEFATGKDKKGAYNDPVLRELHRGIAMRNRLVHRPTVAPTSEDVAPVLSAVRDLLGMLDYYGGGTPLGGSFISPSTRQIWWKPDAKRPQ